MQNTRYIPFPYEAQGLLAALYILEREIPRSSIGTLGESA